MTDLHHLASDISRERTAAIERLVIETVERHLRRVPTNEEVAKNGRRVVDRYINVEHFYWVVGELTIRLFTIANHPKGFGFDVKKFV